MQQLGLELSDDAIKEVTAQIKKLADVRPQSVEDVDLLLKDYHRGSGFGVEATTAAATSKMNKMVHKMSVTSLDEGVENDAVDVDADM